MQILETTCYTPLILGGHGFKSFGKLRILTPCFEESTSATIFWELFLTMCQCHLIFVQLKHNFCILFLSSTEPVIQAVPIVLYIVLLHGTVDVGYY